MYVCMLGRNPKHKTSRKSAKYLPLLPQGIPSGRKNLPLHSRENRVENPKDRVEHPNHRVEHPKDEVEHPKDYVHIC